MPSIRGRQRIGRSFVSPTGVTNEVSRVLDFQLATDQGIQIEGVLGYGVLHDDTPATSDTVPIAIRASQTLHLEEGATEDLPISTGEDADDLDTEIFYGQVFTEVFQVPATAGGGGGFGYITPSGIWVPPEPILSARNITHKGTTVGADADLEAGVFIYYHFVEFSNAELGVILSRR